MLVKFIYHFPPVLRSNSGGPIYLWVGGRGKGRGRLGPHQVKEEREAPALSQRLRSTGLRAGGGEERTSASGNTYVWVCACEMCACGGGEKVVCMYVKVCLYLGIYAYMCVNMSVFSLQRTLPQLVAQTPFLTPSTEN